MYDPVCEGDVATEAFRITSIGIKSISGIKSEFAGLNFILALTY